MATYPSKDPLQLVYISARPDRIARSIGSFRRYYAADRVVVLTADAMKAKMVSALDGLGIAATVLADGEVLAEHGRYAEHAERNCRLRAALYRHDSVEDVFLAMDDDCILLRELPDDHFVDNGRMVARYSHPTLSGWKSASFGEPTSFDRQQWNTAEMLAGAGLPEKGFAAHQAQIIDKAAVNAVFDEFLPGASGPICEWGLYFNAVCARQPDRFVARPTTTLFWPESFDSWLPDWFEDEFRFENFYPHLYERGGALAEAGLTPDSDWRLKRTHATAQYAAHHAQRMLNELSNGETPSITLAEDNARGLVSNAGQLFGFPGMILKLPIGAGDGRSCRMDYAILEDGRPVAESASPTQEVGPRADLAVRLPPRTGEFALVIRNGTGNAASHLSLPLFVLPWPGRG